jgi:predicted DNA-binding protein with PD1-like motif
LGRIANARIAPNEDLVLSVQTLAKELGFVHAYVRSALGSLVDAALARSGGEIQKIPGPAIEIVCLSGEVCPDEQGQPRCVLSGVVSDLQGQLHGGLFLVGLNPVCMTIELMLEEWLPEDGAGPS